MENVIYVSGNTLLLT